jgi:hypothetical protein
VKNGVELGGKNSPMVFNIVTAKWLKEDIRGRRSKGRERGPKGREKDFWL